MGRIYSLQMKQIPFSPPFTSPREWGLALQGRRRRHLARSEVGDGWSTSFVHAAVGLVAVVLVWVCMLRGMGRSRWQLLPNECHCGGAVRVCWDGARGCEAKIRDFKTHVKICCQPEVLGKGWVRGSLGHQMARAQWVEGFVVWFAFCFGSFWFQACFHNHKSPFPLAFSPPNQTSQTWAMPVQEKQHCRWSPARLQGWASQSSIHEHCHSSCRLNTPPLPSRVVTWRVVWWWLGREQVHLCLLWSARSLLGSEEVSCSCRDDCLHSQETKFLILLQCLSFIRIRPCMFLKLPETDWDTAVPTLARKGCAESIPLRTVVWFTRLHSAWTCFSVTLWGLEDTLCKISCISLCCWLLLNSLFISADVFSL